VEQANKDYSKHHETMEKVGDKENTEKDQEEEMWTAG